ncbi:hypothetical protein A3I99_03285 [Candidatus Kaiserbacteria bacterium RIFCSPLOWO2_02_FULL_45_11b]|uniref:Uncharacterized protein n=1 Tax=Candidatus Kaiserbacteria bacterium RIFCSPLOWO2_12_FULL_45_26 TaxID=1798525 RepID=A0A1F6FG03_9BACT|nr:MAG: hypothetical protein A2929_05000 [Candidatus Kaiserbacteria bacterium RIFCSPLOWO2_01_FULL_45_25]OGG80810.1 MAG: hypothetical protein A3I99_03285 [Candidatus Kaiserbacteria bacterium RIFCSPLOWO2_02_FULL_45_11b]OGG84780.1 MAG: hypothetical protein A3G90_01705 [Candidatus Kaiserbacteria bacterium RIFCSPLOWO2_12_FULL_45_26]
MCKVFIVGATGVRKIDSADLEAGVRLAQTFEKLAARDKPKPVAKMQSKPVARVCGTYAPAPLQQGGHLVKPFVEDKDDYGDHYRMRCNASHERRKTRFLTERRREVVRY